MSNKEEYNRILEVIDINQFSDEKAFADSCGKKFRNVRNAFYVVLIVSLFYMMWAGALFPKNDLIMMVITLSVFVTILAYMKQRKILHRELNTYLFRECYPDKGLSRYANFIPMMLKKQVLWSKVHYNLGMGLYYLGWINKASEMLRLMEASCTTANDMLLALQLKQLIALYYMDLDVVMSCADAASMLYSKASKSEWMSKVCSDLQTTAAFASCYRSRDYRKAYQILGTPCERPLDEVKRSYYLYLAAIASSDFEYAGSCKNYVLQNAGTTWYGRALHEGFVAEAIPSNYPGFMVNVTQLQNPSKIDKSRYKYLLAGVLLTVLMFLVPQLIRMVK
ncbi:hypothetical protein [Butyrivibrio sp. AE3004]|uniref:hypothetical protein n=1 Tax=Butyrivibrio sp. AE3004 TaxID=1506994 RepID=UPI000493C2DD|nr:hypothetical protein [Butyrivibrio sp. AE3004]